MRLSPKYDFCYEGRRLHRPVESLHLCDLIVQLRSLLHITGGPALKRVDDNHLSGIKAYETRSNQYWFEPYRQFPLFFVILYVSGSKNDEIRHYLVQTEVIGRSRYYNDVTIFSIITKNLQPLHGWDFAIMYY